MNRAGLVYEIEESVAPLADHEKVLGAVLVFHDVSEARKIANQMAHLANHDTLTDLPNRALLNDRLDKALHAARRDDKRLALMFLDIDNFKNINDSLGHDVGDQLLVEIAARLKAVVRSSDTISRQGGDEFIILLHEVCDKLAPAEVANKVLEAVSGIHHVGGHEVRVSASVGIAVYPDDGSDAESLTKCADSAMYHAKGMGRNNFQFFTRAMTQVVAERIRLENSLRRAIERDEFVLHYQPKVSLSSGRIIGAEVLLRWEHPDEGLVPPARFISTAEQSGLIRQIGSWVLREACRQSRAWQTLGMPAIPMAVNLSAIQLHHEGFLDEVTSVLRELRIAPHLLEFEVTESISIHGEEKAVAWLETLRDMGVKLSIDDFGTGYSSLSYLKRLPIDTIKIDQSFIRDITTDPDDAAIITAIIRMAHTLRLNVIAEGVETPEQLDFLRERKCNQVQGHFFSAPIPAQQFEELLLAQEAA
jgi:diguanylate cyclase (GGDEF)-like protein